jgi:phage terminase large subunit-like protein
LGADPIGFGGLAGVAKARWSLTARPNQLPPDWDWRYWVLCCGRGFGKTRAAAEFVRMRMNDGAWERAAFVGATESDYRDTMIEGPSGLIAVHRWDSPAQQPTYVSSKKRVEYPNGAIILLYSAEKPERIHGPNLDGAWFDELGVYPTRGAFDEVDLALRAGKNPQAVISTTPEDNKPEALGLLEELIGRSGDDVAVVFGDTEENIHHLSPSYIKSVVEPLRKTRKGRAKLSGDISVLLEKEGALWNTATLDDHRISHAEAMRRVTRIAVAIDPGTSKIGAFAGETGIAVVGADADQHLYMLEDCSGKYSPEGWARRAVDAYHRYDANMLVAEVNQGGDMVASVIRQVEGAPLVQMVRASHGKVARAEPVAYIFPEGRGHMAGLFPELERQMVTFVPHTVTKSPDRLDAFVWGAYAVLKLVPSGKRVPPGVVVTAALKSGWTRAARRGNAAGGHQVASAQGLLGNLRRR